MTRKVRVAFLPAGKRVEINAGLTVLEAAKYSGVDIKSLCGGRGQCGKCKVILRRKRAQYDKLSDLETRWLTKEEVEKGYRMACCTVVRDNSRVIVPRESRTGVQRLQIEGVQVPIVFEPLIKKLYVELPLPSLGDQRSDVDRLLETLKKRYNLSDVEIDYINLKMLPKVLREAGWIVTVVLWNDHRIIDVESGAQGQDKSYGLAVDVGTTKIAGYLVDLNTGHTICATALMNPQIPYGEDIMSRIAYVLKKGRPGLDKLQRLVVHGINEILRDLLQEANVEPENVCEVTVVGNTAMHHLFLGMWPKSVALSPYVPVVRGALDVKASNLGLCTNSNANVHVFPLIAGFVGADCVADILATEIYKSDELSFMIDVGTNTEIVIGKKEGMVACSCASGPAFEGAHIKHGMHAAKGAIERVKIDPKTLRVKYQTVGEEKPSGICGSALVDIVAEMLKASVIDTTGTFNKDLLNPRVRLGIEGFYEFVLAAKEEAATQADIVITQRDIRELQFAKAAMYAGASILMKRLEIASSDIQRVFIAGAFGNYINPENAWIIGMYPDVPLERVRFVGNAAGSGARMALLSKEARHTTEIISKRVRYIELAADPSFQEEFLKANYFPHQELELFPQVKRWLAGSAQKYRSVGSMCS